jgi:hypothetical protein
MHLKSMRIRKPIEGIPTGSTLDYQSEASYGERAKICQLSFPAEPGRVITHPPFRMM